MCEPERRALAWCAPRAKTRKRRQTTAASASAGKHRNTEAECISRALAQRATFVRAHARVLARPGSVSRALAWCAPRAKTRKRHSATGAVVPVPVQIRDFPGSR